MLSNLQQQHLQSGVVKASRRWQPACSRLVDTSRALTGLASQPAGTYMLDSNRCWSMFQIALAINQRYQFGWRVEPDDSFIFDQRMQDPRVELPALNDYLPLPNGR